MKKIIILLSMILVSCSRNLWKESIVVNFESASNKLYYLSDSFENDIYYISSAGDAITLPKLPYGFILQYETGEDLKLIEGYPSLFHEVAIEAHKLLPIPNIKKVYVSDAGLYLKVSDSDDIYFIDYMNPEILVKVRETHFLYNKYIEFAYITEGIFKENTGNSSIGIQDAVKNKKYNTTYSTPVIGGIIKLLMVNIEDENVFIGQTIYSYFMFYPKTGKVDFLKDENEYKKLIYDNFYTGNVWESSYFYHEQKLSNFENYTISEYSQQ